MDIDINDLRSLVLVACFTGFVGVWIWAWRKDRKQDFEESANLPLEEDHLLTRSTSSDNLGEIR